MIRSVLFIWLLCAAAVWAQSLEAGYEALERGEVERCRSIFSKAKGEEGRVARARLSIVLGRPEEALEELRGESVATQVTRLEALCRSDYYTDARLLLRKLEQEAHGSFEAPFDFQFYLFRGLIERKNGHPELARKNYELAIRRAQTADRKCQAHDELTAMWIERRELEKAAEAYSQSAKLMNKLQSVWVLADHLDVGSDLEYERGDLANAAVLNRAFQQLCLSNQNPVRAARALQNSAALFIYSNDFLGSLSIHEAVLKSHLDTEAYHAVASCLLNFHMLYFNLASQKGYQEFDLIHQDTISRMPPGLAKERAQLVYADFLLDAEQKSEDAVKLYGLLCQSSHQKIRCLAHQGLSGAHRKQGRYDEARRELDKALEESVPDMMRRDIDWRSDRGAVLLRIANLEKNRHNAVAALEFIQRGIASNPDPDWAFWRIEARYDSLMAAVSTQDLELARNEFAASLVDMDKLPRRSARASALTLILAALLLNQSVGDDVIEPAELLLGNYSEVADKLLEEAFRDPALAARYLGYFDDWQRDSEARKQTWSTPQVIVYKGLFLEALGHLDEASLSLTSALEMAKEHQVLQAEMLSQLLLARIYLRQNQTAQAVDYLEGASKASQKLNPQSARFYLLVTGAGQRDGGRLAEALASFTEAIELEPDKAWSGLYGRALTLEKLGRTDQALEDLDAALEQLKRRGRAVSTARLQAAKAQILVNTGRLTEAEKLFAASHQELVQLGAVASLYQVTLNYADCLTQMSKGRACLDLLVETLDLLSDWQALTYRQGKPLFERVVSLALSLKEEQTALRFLQLSHSAELLESVDLSKVQTGDEITQKLLREVSSLKRQLVGLQDRPGQTKDGLGTLLAETRQEFFAKLNELRRSEPDFEALVQLSGSQLSSIQELLSPQSALIEYFPAQNTLYLFVVTREEFTLHQVGLSRPELEKLVERYLKASSRPDSNITELHSLSRRLRQILITSAGDRLEGISNLRIVPSGPLWEVSFSSLMGPQGTPLVEDFEVSYITSSDLARIRRTESRMRAIPKRPLLVSGAHDLRGAKAEVQTLAERFANSVVLDGPTLSSESFLANIRGHDLVHIASHSRVGREVGQSYVELGNDRLTLEQIYGLELEPSSLIVLSSCRSGVGAESPGKEVTSLASAFSVAGASTVVASRWRVDDMSTAQFFADFYQALLQGRLRGQAFREAELKMAKRHPHPYYWAGFSLLGDPD
jgi:CHAT domain-containing protein